MTVVLARRRRRSLFDGILAGVAASALAACGDGDAGGARGAGGGVVPGPGPGAADLRAAPAGEDGPASPDWVRPGTRLTFWAGAVSIEGTREAIYVEDPQGPFHDYEGRRYRLDSSASDRGQGDDSGGHGYSQVDVVAVAGDRVFLSTRGLVMDDVNVPPVLTAIQGSVVDRATGGGLWAPPAALAAARSTRDRKVLVGPYVRGRTTHDAVVFTEGKSARVYDRATGLLLVERLSAQSQRGFVWRNGFYMPAPPRTSGALMLFESQRTINIPWAGGTPPEAARRTRALRYTGGGATMMPGSGTMVIPGSLAIRKVADHGAAMEYLYVYDTPPFGPQPHQHSEVAMVSAPGSIGGAWLPAEALATLRKGQHLDSDPVARSALTVTHAGRTLFGKDVVTLTERAKRFTAEWTYDRRTGLLRTIRLDLPQALSLTSYQYDFVKSE